MAKSLGITQANARYHPTPRCQGVRCGDFADMLVHKLIKISSHSRLNIYIAGVRIFVQSKIIFSSVKSYTAEILYNIARQRSWFGRSVKHIEKSSWNMLTLLKFIDKNILVDGKLKCVIRIWTMLLKELNLIQGLTMKVAALFFACATAASKFSINIFSKFSADIMMAL